MKTQKQLIEAYKIVRITVMAFENGVRFSTYGNIDILTAIEEVSRHTKAGRMVLILSVDNHFHMRWELENHTRVPYELVLPQAISISTVFRGSILIKYK